MEDKQEEEREIEGTRGREEKQLYRAKHKE